MGSGRRAVPAVGAAVLVVLIGFGRAYLGAHYLSDVVGGFAAGGAWLGAVIAGWEEVGRRWYGQSERLGKPTLNQEFRCSARFRSPSSTSR